MNAVSLLMAGWELGWHFFYNRERAVLFRQAREAAQRRGKPLLVVGEPMRDAYGCGDVTVDIAPPTGSRCPNYVQASVEDMPMFRDGQFGAVLCAHVLEHVCRPYDAQRELHRVADEVFVAWPRPITVVAWAVPGHRWTMHRRADGLFDFRPIPGRRRCNVPDRHGTGAGGSVAGLPPMIGRP